MWSRKSRRPHAHTATTTDDDGLRRFREEEPHDVGKPLPTKKPLKLVLTTAFTSQDLPRMSNELRDKFHGQTIEEHLERVPNELAVDAVGLWQIVSFGRQGFGLSGESLAAFVRQHLLGLLKRGAKPVIGAQDGIHLWAVVNYGETPEQIADAVLKEWQLSGHDPDPGGIWFALRHIYEATNRKMESCPSRRLD
jgi:hypothetical protein